MDTKYDSTFCSSVWFFKNSSCIGLWNQVLKCASYQKPPAISCIPSKSRSSPLPWRAAGEEELSPLSPVPHKKTHPSPASSTPPACYHISTITCFEKPLWQLEWVSSGYWAWTQIFLHHPNLFNHTSPKHLSLIFFFPLFLADFRKIPCTATSALCTTLNLHFPAKNCHIFSHQLKFLLPTLPALNQAYLSM